MERFANFGQYQMVERRVRDAAKEAGARSLSNDFLLPDAARTLIAEKRLSFEVLAGNLYLLRDHGTFHTLSFVIAHEASAAPVFVPRATKVVWPYRAAASDSAATPDHAGEVISRMGFARVRTLARLRLPAKDVSDGEGDASAEGVGVGAAGERDREAILSLLRSNFDYVLGELPDVHGLEADIAAGRVLVARADAAVIGVLRVGVEGRAVWIRQIAVGEGARGRHVGRALVDAQLRRFSAQAREFDLWVDVTNEPAIRLYAACGYRPTGHRADEYLPR